MRKDGKVRLTVAGKSMNPTLLEGDVVTIKQCDDYHKGDIVVFRYKDEGVLIHRLIKHTDRYFCKGDNSYRLEDITFDQIIGKVVLINTSSVLPWDDWKIELSYLVNREFVRLRYDVSKVLKTNIYKLYSDLVLSDEKHIIKYKIAEYINFSICDTKLKVVDQNNNRTYYLGRNEITIINCLENSCDINCIITKFCEVHSVSNQSAMVKIAEFLIFAPFPM